MREIISLTIAIIISGFVGAAAVETYGAMGFLLAVVAGFVIGLGSASIAEMLTEW